LSADFFSPYKGAWSSLPILDQPRSFAVVVATPADIFVAGGGNGMDWYNTVVRCDRCENALLYFVSFVVSISHLLSSNTMA